MALPKPTTEINNVSLQKQIFKKNVKIPIENQKEPSKLWHHHTENAANDTINITWSVDSRPGTG